MRKLDIYVHIREAALGAQYDKGSFPEHPTAAERRWLDAAEAVVGAEGVDEDDLRRIDMFLRSLSMDGFSIVSYGTHLDADRITARGPKDVQGRDLTKGLLADLFAVAVPS